MWEKGKTLYWFVCQKLISGDLKSYIFIQIALTVVITM